MHQGSGIDQDWNKAVFAVVAEVVLARTPGNGLQ